MTRPASTRQRSLEPSEVHSSQSAVKEEPVSPIGNEGSEKPVREQLQKTSIAAKEAAGITSPEDTSSDSDGHTSKHDKLGKIRKRSAEELDLEENDGFTVTKSGKHVRRKTSHESLNSSDAASVSSDRSNNLGESAIAPNGSGRARSHTPESTSDKGHEVLTSPKNKRNREQFLHDHTSTDHSSSLPPPTEQQIPVAAPTTLGDEERVYKRQRSGSPDPKSGATEPINLRPGVQSKSQVGSTQTFSQFSAARGFSDTSASSPFAALASQQPKPNSQSSQTSHDAFASSAFGALASSSTSGFGALGKSLGKGSFLAALRENTSPPAAEKANSSSVFPRSPFATIAPTTTNLATSGFASFFGGSGSGFGALNTDGKKLESFAGGSRLPAIGLGDKPRKPFGAADDEDDAEQEDDGQETAEFETQDPPTDEGTQDPRFHPQAVSSGEEDEETIFSARARLFVFIQDGDKKSWKERGVGLLKLNVPKTSSSDAGKKARLLMRAEGSQRLVLNTPITKDFKFGTVTGDKPTSASNMFLGTLPGQAELLSMQLKVLSSNLIAPNSHTQQPLPQTHAFELMHENLTGHRRSPPATTNSGSESTRSNSPSERRFAKTSLEKNQELWEIVQEVQSEVIEFTQPTPTMAENVNRAASNQQTLGSTATPAVPAVPAVPSQAVASQRIEFSQSAPTIAENLNAVASNQQTLDSTATPAVPSQAVATATVPSQIDPPPQRTQRRRRTRKNRQQPNEPLRRSSRPHKLSLKGQESYEYLQRTAKRVAKRR